MNSKEILSKVLRGISWFLGFLPIKKNKIVFSSYSGSQYSCNPKYIYEYLKAHYKGYKYVWAFKNCNQFRFLECEDTRIIKYNGFLFMYHCMTAGAIIINVELSPCVLYRTSGQLRINTWHGGGCYKKAGMDDSLPDQVLKRMKHTYGKINCWLSSSEYFSRNVIRGSFHFGGKIINSGMPRNDCLLLDITKQKREMILSNLGIENASGMKILLYAPSFREFSNHNAIDTIIFNHNQLIEVLEQRDGCTYCFVCRSHHYMKDAISLSGHCCIDATGYPDMQELLQIADILITDYSSVIWDYALMNKECYLYTPDLEEYIMGRSFYKHIKDWGFPVACDENILVNLVRNREGVGRGEKHHQLLQSYEKGNACQIVAQQIIEYILDDGLLS